MYDVIVNEEQLSKNCQVLHRRCLSIEDRLETYLYLLSKMRSEAVIAGDLARGLTAFKTRAQQLRFQFSGMSADFNELCASYKREVDAADDLLFY